MIGLGFKATKQQQLFIDEWLKLRKKSQTKAAINAGYSEKSASSQASQLLNNPNVKEYLAHREKQLEQELRDEFFYDALEARKVMNDIMNDEEAKDSDRLNAAKDFLDRAGFKPKEKVELSGDLGIATAAKEIDDFFNGSGSQ